MWIADVRFEEVSTSVERTDDNGTTSCLYPEKPRNLDLIANHEENSDLLTSWSQSGERFKISVLEKAFEGHNVAVLEWADKNEPMGEFERCEANSAYLCQRFRAKPFRQSRIKFSAFIKTEEVRDEAVLVLMINGVNQARVALSRMNSLIGNNDWAEHSCVLDVSNFAYSISIWLQMTGPGKTSFAKVAVEKVGYDVATTDGNNRPTNLDFRL